MRRRIVGTVALLIGVVLLVLPWVLQRRLSGGFEDFALLVSGLMLSVFGGALTPRGHSQGRTP